MNAAVDPRGARAGSAGRRTAALVLTVGLLATAAGCAAGDPAADDGAAVDALLVAAASDLRPAFEELGGRFAAATGTAVTFDFGSSGQLAQRIVEGAPVDLFASADVGFVERVLAGGIGDDATQRTYAYGRVVLWAGEGRWAGWDDLADVAADPEVVHLAIANPEHAPYGRAAQQALAATGVLDEVRDRLVFGEHIADTQRLVETGNADVGIVALSLALAADARGVGTWVPIGEDLHEPLQQDLVVTASDPARAEVAARFAELVASDEGREVMRRWGFLLPDDEVPS